MKTLELNSVKVSQIVARCGDRSYIWREGCEKWEDKAKNRRAYEDAHPSENVISLSDVCADYDTDKAYIFCVADCYDPPVYLVFGSSLGDAHETFVTEFESIVKIEESDLADYDEDRLHINDNGTPVDTESVQYIAIDELVITSKVSPE